MGETLDGEVLLRIDRAVERFEDAWRCGAPMPLEDLLRAEAAPAARAELLRYALAVELAYRRDRGETPTLEEYERRFPEHPEIVRRAFAAMPTSSDPPGTRLLPSSSDPSDAVRPPATAPEPLPATIGRFDVVKRLGGGGQGSTYLARDPALGRLVVLKRYHASARVVDLDPTQEAQALARIRSRYTAQCYELMRHGDTLYLVMEYIPGRDLSDAAKGRALATDAAAHLIERVAEGLEAVHACGLVHRDVKPANLVVGDDGVPRLVDFGLAAHLGSPALRGVSGTAPYMAPEQARDQWERIDARTDVYGLGATLYALLTGRPPHPGRTPHEVLLHASEGAVTPPRALNRSLPRPLERLVLRALAADPAQRFATAAEFRQALRSYRLRNRRRAAIGLIALLGLFLAWWIWPRPTDHAITAANPSALSGELTVRVWSPGTGGKRGGKVEDPGTLPVLPGERVHLEARLSRPAYAYLLWLDGQGQVASLYPWRDPSFKTRPAEEAEATVHSPEELDKGWPMTGPPGLETALLLVRTTPLPPETELAKLIGRLPPSRLRDPLEVAVLGFDPGQPAVAVKRSVHRSLIPEAEEIDDPLLRVMEKLRKHFEVIRAVRFAYQGE